MDWKEAFEKLSQVDNEHFAIVEKECIEIYKNENCFATPMPRGMVAISIDTINEFKSTLIELSEANGTANQKEVCDFLISYMKQIGLY